MDISERYIRKCRLAFDLQEHKKKFALTGDRMVTADGIVMILNKDEGKMLHKVKRDDVMEPFFLLDQEFLQRTVNFWDLHPKALKSLTEYFNAYAVHAKHFLVSQSMDEFWLDFVMFNVYKKQWSYLNKEWIELTTVKLEDVVAENNITQEQVLQTESSNLSELPEEKRDI